MHAPMFMAYQFIFAESGPTNLIEWPYITSGSTWNNSSSGSTLTYGQTDEDGGSNAVLVDLIGVDNHQVWYDLTNPLTLDEAYTLSVYFKDGPTPMTDTLQMAYYTGGTEVNGTEVSIDGTWTQYDYSFIAGDDVNNDPSIRLIGFSNGSDGESVYIGEVLLTEKAITGDGSEILTDTTMYSGSAWQFLSGHSVTYGVADSQGGTTAARVTMVGPDSHHIEHDLSQPLVEGNAYTISVRLQQGPGGFADVFQLAYYDTNGEVSGSEVAVPNTWGVIEHKFICPAHNGTSPRVRLLGFSNGVDGEEVEIDYASLVEGTTSPI